MSNQLIAVFDMPQNSLSTSESGFRRSLSHSETNLVSGNPGFLDFQDASTIFGPFHQNTGWDESQQITILPTRDYSASNIRRHTDRAWASWHQQSCPNRDFTAQLRALQQHYTMLDDDRTINELLATEPALYWLLIEAVEPLRHAFGDKRLIYIRIQSSDEDNILKVTIRLPANFGDNPEGALEAFDKEWWLKNCHRSNGTLVFDYEMQNAI